MKRLLMTGKAGFIGKNIRPILTENYETAAPHREPLDLIDHRVVETYLEQRIAMQIDREKENRKDEKKSC